MPATDHCANLVELMSRPPLDAFPQQRRLLDSVGVTLIQADLGPYDFSDVPLPEQVLHVPLNNALVWWNRGSGWNLAPGLLDHCLLDPPDTQTEWRTSQVERVLLISWSVSTARTFIEPFGHKDLDVFAPLAERTFFDPLIVELARHLWREAGAESSTTLLAEQAFYALLSSLLRSALTAPRWGDNSTPVGLTDRQLLLALDYLHAHLTETITLADLAAATHLSPYHFARQFKHSTGRTPHQYLIQLRQQKAQRLLTTTDLPLAQVALAAGLGSQSHMTHVFRRLLGLTPFEVRRRR